MSNITTYPTINDTYSIINSSLPSTSSNSTITNINSIYSTNYTITNGYTGTHGPYIISGPSGYNMITNYNTTYGVSNLGYTGYVLSMNNYNLINGYTGDNNLFYNTYTSSSIYNDIYTRGPICYDTIIKNIQHIGSKLIPKNSYDIITYEEIGEGDILINFNRDSNKTEYDYNTFYKFSTLIEILKSKKNQFTMKEIDISSIVKYNAKIE